MIFAKFSRPAKFCREISLCVAVCCAVGPTHVAAQQAINKSTTQTTAKTTVLPDALTNSTTISAGQVGTSTVPNADANVMQASCTGCSDASCSGCADAGGFGCGSSTCGTMCGCVSFYGGVEYLFWWDKKTSLTGLVNESPAGTLRENAAVNGFSSNLFGGQDIDDESLFGERITLGTLFANGETGVFGRFFFLEDQSEVFSTNSAATPIFGRPFFNIDSNEEDAVVLSFPNDTSGNINIDWDSETFGAEVLVRQLFRSDCNYRVDLVYGYRHFSLEESLRIDSSLEFIDPTAIFFGSAIDQFDSFEIENKFHGFDFGFMGHSVDGCWTLDFVAKVAFGNVNQSVTVNGQTTTTPVAGAASVISGGLLAQDSNIGTFEIDQFAVMPEFGATLGYAITPRFDAFVGYNFIYINHVARTSSVIDRSVNLLQQQGLGGEARPAPSIDDNDYWLQGLTFGVSTRF